MTARLGDDGGCEDPMVNSFNRSQRPCAPSPAAGGGLAFFDPSGRSSRAFRKSQVLPVSAALGRLDALKVKRLLRRGVLNGAVGGPRLLKVDPAVALPVWQPGRMHGERDDVEGR